MAESQNNGQNKIPPITNTPPRQTDGGGNPQPKVPKKFEGGVCDPNTIPLNPEQIQIETQLKSRSPILPTPTETTPVDITQQPKNIFLNRKVEQQEAQLTIPAVGSKTQNLENNKKDTIIPVENLLNEFVDIDVVNNPELIGSIINDVAVGDVPAGGQTGTGVGGGAGGGGGSGGGGGAGGGGGSGGGGGGGAGGGGRGGSSISAPDPQLGKSNGQPVEKRKSCVEGMPDRSIFPFNSVLQTESGHVAEMDNTPGGERIHVIHRTGTNIEFLPAGSMSTVVTRDLWFSVFRDAHLHVDGYTDVTIDKALRVIVNKDKIKNTPEKSVNFDVYVGGNSNVNLYVKGGNVNVTLEDGDVNMHLENGDMNIRQNKGNYNHFVNGDYNLEVTGNMHTVVGKSELREIGESRETIINGKYDSLKLSNVSGEIHISCYLYELLGSMKKEQLYGNCLLTVGDNYNVHVMGNHNLEIMNTLTTQSKISHIFTNSDYLLTIGGVGHFYTHMWERKTARLRRPDDNLCPDVLQSKNKSLALIRPDILALEYSEPRDCTPNLIIDLDEVFSSDLDSSIKNKKFIQNDAMFSRNKIGIKNRSGYPLYVASSWKKTQSRKRDN